jgi:hypothetical protein
MKEALKAKYAELLQEVGKRNATADAERIKKIKALCDELLSNENAEESRVEEAIKECDACMVKVKEAEVVRIEEGEAFPASAYAYCPDPEKPSDWKLRLQDKTHKVTRAQLGAAAAAFSPGGFRGQKVQIPEADVSEAKRKIRSAYKSLDVADDDIPKWVKEANEFRDYIYESVSIDITEATAELLAKGILPIRIIQPGFNAGKGRFYSEGAVKDAARVFNDTKMYANHPTPSEEKERPERDIRDWVATLKNTRMSPQGNAIGEAHIHAGWFKEMAQNLLQTGNLNQLGTSINAIGKGSRGKVGDVDTFIVEGLTRGRSVDFVTEPGAGGRAGLTESAKIDIIDTLKIDLDTLKEVRPDLVEAIKAEGEPIKTQEAKRKMELEEKTKELQEANDKLTKENTELKKATAQAQIKEAVEKTKLPDPAKARILAMFKEATTLAGLEEAIKAETDYVAILTESGKVKGMGPQGKADTEATRKALEESFQGMGLSKEAAKIAADGR